MRGRERGTEFFGDGIGYVADCRQGRTQVVAALLNAEEVDHDVGFGGAMEHGAGVRKTNKRSHWQVCFKRHIWWIR